MNLSGQSVGEVLRFYKIPVENVIVLHDELDLPPGKLRVKRGGGHGGHNGLKSIDAHCGKEYRRIRLGIGHPGDKSRVHGHVLGDFSKAEQDGWLMTLLDAVAAEFGRLTKGDDGGFMSKVSAIVSPPKPKAPKRTSQRPTTPRVPVVPRVTRIQMPQTSHRPVRGSTIFRVRQR